MGASTAHITDHVGASLIRRRRFLGAGALGALGVAVPWASTVVASPAGAEPAGGGGFRHGVASGDPTATSVMIWTRYTPRVGDGPALPGSGLGDPVTVRWAVYPTSECTTAIRTGEIATSANSDHTVRVDVTGLEPYTEYHYRFSVGEGEVSPTGRMRTAPDEPGRTHALRLAQVSCANLTGGFFGTYRAIAERDDLDVVLHLGDYFYEYGNGEDRYGPEELIGVRDHEPAHETVSLADYRQRLAQYRADADCLEMHRRHTVITVFDDHEIANNAWSDGAENHDEATEGDYDVRMSAAFQAYIEWLPIRLTTEETADGTRFYRRFTFGELADLSVIDTRQHRSEQVGSFVVLGDPATDAQIQDPERHIMDPEQMRWLQDGIAAPRRWHLVANQVMVSPLALPGQYMGAVQGSVAVNADAWDGYRADQQSLLRHMADQPAEAGDTVVLTGDIHSSWTENLLADSEEMLPLLAEVYPQAAEDAALTAAPDRDPQLRAAPAARDGSPVPPMVAHPVPIPQLPSLEGLVARPAGVEFVCPSVTSDGFYEIIRSALQSPTLSVAAAETASLVLRALNPSLQWMDGIGHGYILIDVTPERVQADFFHTDRPTTERPDPRIDPDHRPSHLVASWQTLAGERTAGPAPTPIGPRSDEPRRLPCAPPSPTPEPTDPPPTAEPTVPPPTAEPTDPIPTAEPTDPPPTAEPTAPVPTAGGAGPSPTPSAPGLEPGTQQGTGSTPVHSPRTVPTTPEGDRGMLARTGAAGPALLGGGLAAVVGGLGLTAAARARGSSSTDGSVDVGAPDGPHPDRTGEVPRGAAPAVPPDAAHGTEASDAAEH